MESDSGTPYSVTRDVENGIERITYTPETMRHETPVLFQHGKSVMHTF